MKDKDKMFDKNCTEVRTLERIPYRQAPPRVEYKVTDFGKKILKVLDQIEKRQREIESKM